MLFGTLNGFFFHRIALMAIFLAQMILNHSTTLNSKTERGVAFNDFLVFDDFSPFSANAFAISVHCLIIVANINVKISRHSVKAFCGLTFLSNSCKILSFLLHKRCFLFLTICHASEFRFAVEHPVYLTSLHCGVGRDKISCPYSHDRLYSLLICKVSLIICSRQDGYCSHLKSNSIFSNPN